MSGFSTMTLCLRLSTSLPSLYLYVLHCMLKSYSLSRAKDRFIFFYNKPIANCILGIKKKKVNRENSNKYKEH